MPQPFICMRKRGVRVLGHGLDGDAADFVKRLAPQHRARAAEEGRIPEIVAVLHNAVKQLALVGNDPELPQVPLEGIGRIEVVRRLQHGQFRSRRNQPTVICRKLRVGT